MYQEETPQSDQSERRNSFMITKTIKTLFPLRLDHKDQTLMYLKKHFDLKLHLNYLVNNCYRCYDLHRSSFYNRFRTQNYPELKEPSISRIYSNEDFTPLEEIGKWLQNPSALKYPSPAQKIPQSLLQTLQEISDYFGYVPSLERFMLFYPSYLDKHFYLYRSLIIQSDFHPQEVYFIGFCTASEMGCPYMMTRMLSCFLKFGGKVEWITLQEYPSHFKSVISIIRKIGRSPWLLTEQMMKNILDETWNHQSFIQIFLLILFIQRMSTISLAVGLIPEEVHEFDPLKRVIQIKKKYDETYETESTSKAQNEKNHKKEKQPVQAYMTAIGNYLWEQSLYKEIIQALSPLLPVFEVIEKRKDDADSRFDYSEYNFEKMCYPILNSLIEDLAPKISEFLKYSEKMSFDGESGGFSFKSSGQTRKAMRYYSENLYGYTHLEYNYKNHVKESLNQIRMNKQMPLSLLFYIRLLTLSPVYLKKQVIDEIKHGQGRTKCFQLGHIALLIADSKMCVTLMIAMRKFHS